MTSRKPAHSSNSARLSTPILTITIFVLALSGCVLGLLAWKGFDARRNALAQSETEMRNLAHSLAEHASHTIQAVDVVTDDLVAFLRLQQTPNRVTFDARLQEVVGNLTQLNDVVILDERGDVKYASLASPPRINNANRGYFIHHRDNADKTLRINGPILSRSSGSQILALTRRIENFDGSFAGVVIATVDSGYFTSFYQRLDLGPGGAITMAESDGRIMVRWPPAAEGKNFANTRLVNDLLQHSESGFNLATSPIDGLTKYYAYERVQRYPLIVTVARTYDTTLSGWREEIRSDAVLAIGLLACIGLLAAVLAGQLRHRARFEALLRERDARHRLIDANIGDIVVLLDECGVINFVSESVAAVLGFVPEELVGRTYRDLVHLDDTASLRATGKLLPNNADGQRAEFRMARADGTVVWLEANFRFTRHDGKPGRNIVCTLRDVTRRKQMENEVEAFNSRLAELAHTDALTGLPNRRSHDDFIERAFAEHSALSVLMIDVDYFKTLNDRLGHQMGDSGLKLIGALLAGAVADKGGLAARYGGEEFAIILPNADLEAAMQLAEAVRKEVRRLGLPNPTTPTGYVTVSIGVSSRTSETRDPGTLVREADMALYRAKHNGRNRCVAWLLSGDDGASLVPAATTEQTTSVPNA